MRGDVWTVVRVEAEFAYTQQQGNVLGFAVRHSEGGQRAGREDLDIETDRASRVPSDTRLLVPYVVWVECTLWYLCRKNAAPSDLERV